MSMKTQLSLPDIFLKQTDWSVLAEPSRIWLELTQPWHPDYRAFHGVWTTDPTLAQSVPDDILCAAPAAANRAGRVVGTIQGVRQAARDRVPFLLLNSDEAAGFCGQEGAFVLIQAAADLGIPAMVRGGVGPQLIAAATLLGLQAVLVEEPLWALLPGLPQAWTELWEAGDPFETRVLGEHPPIRFWARPGFPITRAANARSVDGADWPGWASSHRCTLDLPSHREGWLPAGGAIGLGRALALPSAPRDRLQALEAEAAALTTRVHDRWPWRSDNDWAQGMGTHCPISQGPMANVSDVPAFARDVQQGGAFPWLALASTPEAPARAILSEAANLLPAGSYGVGIIGMSTNPMLETHLRLAEECGIQWVLVAAGTVELALRLEARGMKTLLHTPSPAMLRSALAAGLRRFIWEGREAGGHVGILGSASLWAHNLAILKASKGTDTSVLLAGGLGTRGGAIAAAAFGAALESMGVAAGVQLGSAYVSTQEALATGAVAATYGHALSRASATVVLGESSGAPTRVLTTARATALAAMERDWIAKGLRVSERKHRFERENLGGLRLAAKAQRLDFEGDQPQLTSVEPGEALAQGLFHIGVVAGMRRPSTIPALHQAVTVDLEATVLPPVRSPQRPASSLQPPASGPRASTSSPSALEPLDPDRAIAVVGMAFRLPGAGDSPERLWKLLTSGGSAIGKVPANRWNADLFVDREGRDASRSYTDLGAFLEPFKVDTRRFRIPPTVARALDGNQLLAIALTDEALKDAGYPDEEGARGATDVILGVAQGDDRRERTAARIMLDAMDRSGRAQVLQQLGFDLPKSTEDSLPGELTNVTAGRVASCFDFCGANFTVDAACAGSLAAIGTSVDRLRLGRCDWAITGGVDRNMGVATYVKFCRLGALSRRGSFPFDARADGFVMGEGGAIFVLRRLRDALEAGQTIHGIIRGCGLSSDGRGKGIAAPNPSGQLRAIERAWRDAAIRPDQIGWVEAHGTGTPVGDQAEAETLRQAFAGRPLPIHIGSIKGNIGHLKAAAGAAALVKVLLSLRHDQVPPSGSYDQPRASLKLDGAPLKVQECTQPWPAHTSRTVGISAFGFGGTNAHLVVAGPETAQFGAGLSTPFTADPPASRSPENLAAASPAEGDGASLEAESEETIAATGEAAAPVSHSIHPLPEDSQSISTPIVSHGVRAIMRSTDLSTIEVQITAIVAQISGYEPEEIEPRLDFEGDLGIDTVKIAEIVATVRETFGLPEDSELSLGSISSVSRVADYVRARLSGSSPQPEPAPLSTGDGTGRLAEGSPEAPALEPPPSAAPGEPSLGTLDANNGRDPQSSPSTAPNGPSVETQVTAIVAQISGYEPEEIEPRLDFEGDLGIDTVKIAEIVATVRETFGLPEDADLSLGSISSVSRVAEYVRARLSGSSAQAETAPNSAQPTPTREQPTPHEAVPNGVRRSSLPEMPSQTTYGSPLLRGAGTNRRAGGSPSDAADLKLPPSAAPDGPSVETPAPTGHRPAEDFWGEVQDRVAIAVADTPGHLMLGLKRTGNLGNASGRWRMAAVMSRLDPERIKKGLTEQWDATRWARAGISLVEGPPRGLAFLFPGQGTQRPGLLAELRGIDVVEETIEEAAPILRDSLGIALEALLTVPTPDQEAHLDEQLKQTRNAQPVLLTVGTALHRLLARGGIHPAAVAGHSLGEFGACVAAGVLHFGDALRLVSGRAEAMERVARGLADPGSLVAVALDDVQTKAHMTGSGLSGLELANFNGPTQTVVGGSRRVVADFCAYLKTTGIKHKALKVSHAFHTSIVAPAAEPMARLLADTEVRLPTIPVYSNVTGKPYPMDLNTIRELLSIQLARPVRFAELIQGMVADGIGGFLELGPGRVLAGLTAEITGHRRGAWPSYLPQKAAVDTLAQLWGGAWSVGLSGVAHQDGAVQDGAQNGAPDGDQDGAQNGAPDGDQDGAQDLGQEGAQDGAPGAHGAKEQGEAAAPDSHITGAGVNGREVQGSGMNGQRYAGTNGHEAHGPEGAGQTVSNPEVSAPMAGVGGSNAPMAQAPGTAGLEGGVAKGYGHHDNENSHYQPSNSVENSDESRRMTRAPRPEELVITGAVAGVPGLDDPFAASSFDALFEGSNRITAASQAVKQRITELGIEKVSKDARGVVRTRAIRSTEDTIQFTGKFHVMPDLTRYGVPRPVERSLDDCSRLAVAAGFEALRDAGLPLVLRPVADKSNGRYRLPEALSRRTGVIYATAMAGAEHWIDSANVETPFSRLHLVQALSLGHAHVARFLGITGPTLKVNAACASTLAALSVAQDWITVGRVDRVLIVAADHAGGDALAPYAAAGFLAVGAASTDHDLEHAAQPFGVDRQGTIVGSGAVGLVLERAAAAMERGVRPRARLLGTILSNDACHPMKMNPEAIGATLNQLLESACEHDQIDRRTLSHKIFFVSHEPYTPARGGSAASEASALRTAFGEDVRHIPVANVKGYTGHPMGASVEDAVAIHALERAYLPAVRNYAQQDPALSDLQLSRGQAITADYALRLAAGFGAQIAWALYGRIPGSGPRVDRTRLQSWMEGLEAHPLSLDIEQMVTAPRVGASVSMASRPDDLRVLTRALLWRPLLSDNSSKHSAQAEVDADQASSPSQPPAILARPLTFEPTGPEDVLELVEGWLAQLRGEVPEAVVLPREVPGDWARAAVEALAGATRAFHEEKDRSTPTLVWSDLAEDAAIRAALLAERSEGTPPRELTVAPGQIGHHLWVPISRPLESFSPPKGIWLLAGGGRGITGLLARRWAAAGCAGLWLIGRRPEPEAAAAHRSDEALRQLAKASLEGPRNPQKFQQALDVRTAERELAQTLEALRTSGIPVVYHPCDLTDGAQVRGLETAIRKAGQPLEGVIQAAGVELSASLEKTSSEALARVMAPKLNGTAALLRLARRLDARHWIGFGSLANALGNVGQTGYAAANGAMKGLVEAFRGPLHTQVIEWTAWKGAGMATRGVIRSLLEKRGIALLNPELGFTELEALIAAPERGRSVLICRDVGRALPMAAVPEGTQRTVVTGPLSDPGVDHHRIQGMAVYPGVLGLEQIWHTISPGQGLEVSFERAVRFRDDVDQVLAVTREAAGGRVVELTADGAARRRPAYTYTLGDHAVERPGVFPDGPWRRGPERAALYRRFFHGPRFQVLAGDLWLGEESSWGAASIEGNLPPLRTAAMQVEALLQLAGLWVDLTHGRRALPTRIRARRPKSVAAGISSSDPVQGIVRIRLVARGERDWRFLGEWLDLAGTPQQLITLTLGDAGPMAEDFDGGGLPCVLATRVHGADGKETLARGAIQRRASREAWEVATHRLALGWLGEKGVLLEEPEAGQPMQVKHSKGVATMSWSRSHTEGLAVAAVAPLSVGRVGVDVEMITPRVEGFWQQISSSGERARFGEHYDARTSTVLWCYKEASLKALGIGLKAPVTQVEVQAIFEGTDTILLSGKVAALASELGLGSSLAGRVEIRDGVALAVVMAMPKAGASRHVAGGTLRLDC